jgi:hypothetical protein
MWLLVRPEPHRTESDALTDNTEGYQDRVMGYLNEIRPGASFGRHDQWSVVYCIATSKEGSLAECLYFLAR